MRDIAELQQAIESNRTATPVLVVVTAVLSTIVYLVHSAIAGLALSLLWLIGWIVIIGCSFIAAVMLLFALAGFFENRATRARLRQLEKSG